MPLCRWARLGGGAAGGQAQEIVSTSRIGQALKATRSLNRLNAATFRVRQGPTIVTMVVSGGGKSSVGKRLSDDVVAVTARPPLSGLED